MTDLKMRSHVATEDAPREENGRRSTIRLPALLLSVLLFGLAISALMMFRSGRSATPARESLPALTAGATGVEVGEPAPDFTLNTLSDTPITLSSLKGQPVLVNFWATWCSPCRLEMPDLERAYQKYRDQGFVVLAVDLTYQDSVEAIPPFVEELGLTFPILLDETGHVAGELYELRGVPMSIFIDRDGVVRHVQLGAMNAETIEQHVAEILAK